MKHDTYVECSAGHINPAELCVGGECPVCGDRYLYPVDEHETREDKIKAIHKVTRNIVKL